MRLATTLLLAFFSIGLFTSATEADSGIQFYHDLDKAITAAKKENKLIFLDAYASWCGPCKRMEKKVFSDQVVATYYNENYINVKIDFDKNKALRTKYKVTAYPTLLYLNSDGTIKKRKVGYHNTKEFLAIGKKINK